MRFNFSSTPRIRRFEAILLGAHDSFDQSDDGGLWRISDGQREAACVIPCGDLRNRLLSEPLTSYWMHLIDFGEEASSSDDTASAPVLVAADSCDDHDATLRLLPPSLCPAEGVVKNTIDLIGQIRSHPLRYMVENVFRRRDVTSTYWTAPASRKHHHAYPGGLAAHSLEVAEDLAAQHSLADHERELGIAGGLLHDIGKTWAYTTDMFLSAPARAMGHELLGLSRLEPELSALEHVWPDGAYALRVMLSGNSRMRPFGSMPSSLLARLKAADQYSCERDRAQRNEESAWTPVAYLPLPKRSFDRWADEYIAG
jgi:hypothetical protein